VFLFLTCFAFLYFSQQVRPEEYYFFSLLFILALPSESDSPDREHRFKIPWFSVISMVFLFLFMLFFPVLSGMNGTIAPVDQNLKIKDTSYELPQGHAEFSLVGQSSMLKGKRLRVQGRRVEPDRSPIKIMIRINDTMAITEELEENLFLFDLPLSEPNDLLYTESNSIEFSTEKPESLLLKIRLE